MRKFVALGAIAAAMALGAQTAAAEGFSYNYLEGSYAFADNVDGFGVKGSWALAPSIHVFGGMQNLDADGGGSLDTLNLGVGMNWALSDNLDLVGAVSFERADVGPFDDTGFGVSAGLRGRVTDSVELYGSIKYADLGDFDDFVTFAAGGRYNFTPNFAVGGEFNKVDADAGDADIWMVTLRYDFGR